MQQSDFPPARRRPRSHTASPLALATLLVGIAAVTSARAADDREPREPQRESREAKDDNVVWRERAVPGPAVTLRMHYNVGRSLIYKGTLQRSQKSLNSSEETDSFLLNVLAADKKEIMVKDARRSLDLIAIWRTFTDRKRTEILEKGEDGKKRIDRILENSNDLINLGPNCEMVGTLRCYGFDARNSVAFATQQVITLKDGRQVHGRVLSETPEKIVFLGQEEKLDLKRAEIDHIDVVPVPHVLLNETPHYFFPIFSQRQVAPGDTWKIRVPFIIPLEQGNPPRLLPTQFMAVMIGRLREVRDTPAGQVAIVDYQAHGEFDSGSAEAAARFPEEFRANNRVLHRISASGEAVVDVAKGRILSKNETFTITLYALSIVPQGAGKDALRDENRAEITSHFQLTLLPPGSRLKNGAIVPPYDDEAAAPSNEAPRPDDGKDTEDSGGGKDDKDR